MHTLIVWQVRPDTMHGGQVFGPKILRQGLITRKLSLRERSILVKIGEVKNITHWIAKYQHVTLKGTWNSPLRLKLSEIP